MKIRKENSNDYEEIYTLTKVAFETAKVSDGTEQDFVVMLRNSKNYIPELSLVVVEDDQIIAHIMLTKYKMKGVKALLLAPLTVKKEYRGQSIGTKITNQALHLAREMGYEAVFLVGHEAYYPRFGFQPSILYGIKNINHIPDQNVMALELHKNALQGKEQELDFS